ncbi:MAG TPA: glycosyltransferase [Chitinophagaceae bacterium]|nr:glycosyltransferase [Chitinophagaceae bacterium]
MTEKQLDFCLLIPCYNNLEGLILSLKSVFYDADRFVAVIVDDGSTIPITNEAISKRIKPDYLITILRNDKNRGITDSLNKGLRWIEQNVRATYVARLDCGDICDPNRFYRQIDYMTKHPDTGLLGSWCLFEDKQSLHRYQYKTPTDHEQIMKAMHFRNVFIHPTVIFKTEILKKTGYYPSDFNYAEDYAFFWKLIKISPSHILDDFLVTCETNNEGISSKNRKKQLLARAKCVAKNGTDPILKIVGMLRIKALSIIPKRLALLLKGSIYRQ